jgi:hypothetical protein
MSQCCRASHYDFCDAIRIVGVGLIISLSAIALLKRPRRTASIEAHTRH